MQPFSFDSLTGTLTHTPTSDLPDETVYTISLTAADQAGNTTNGEWKFYINTFPTMPWATDKTCVSCHPNNLNIHLPATPEEKVRYGTTCESCHGNNISTIEQRCISCHKDQWHFTVYPAGSYHEVAFGDRTGIPTLTLDTLHRTESGSCASCHAKSINREHQQPGRTDAAGKPINCDTCHLSTSPTVTQAIYNNQTSCAACHSLGGNGHEAVHITKLDANCTKVCHTASLTQEHMANPKTQKKKLDCDTCHASQDPKHVSAIANNRIECATCHGEAHNMLLALMPDTDIPVLSSLQWTTPVPAKIWRGEVPANLESGYVLISSASETLKGSDVLAFYKAQMINNKWTQTNTDPTDLNNYQLSFTKTSRQALVRFHSVAGIAGPLYRITIVYN